MTGESKMRGKQDGRNEKKKNKGRKAFNSRNEGREIRQGKNRTGRRDR